MIFGYGKLTTLNMFIHSLNKLHNTCMKVNPLLSKCRLNLYASRDKMSATKTILLLVTLSSDVYWKPKRGFPDKANKYDERHRFYLSSHIVQALNRHNSNLDVKHKEDLFVLSEILAAEVRCQRLCKCRRVY